MRLLLYFFLYFAEYTMNWMWMCVCVLFFYPRYVVYMFSVQNFIDSLCRQSVDIGYYYYFGFVLYMACCELISIGYFFLFIRASLSNTCSFWNDVCICACVCIRVSAPFLLSLSTTICRLLKMLCANNEQEKNNINITKIMSNDTFSTHSPKLPLPFVKICFILLERIFNFYCDTNVIWIWVCCGHFFGLVCYWIAIEC